MSVNNHPRVAGEASAACSASCRQALHLRNSTSRRGWSEREGCRLCGARSHRWRGLSVRPAAEGRLQDGDAVAQGVTDEFAQGEDVGSLIV